MRSVYGVEMGRFVRRLGSAGLSDVSNEIETNPLFIVLQDDNNSVPRRPFIRHEEVSAAGPFQ